MGYTDARHAELLQGLVDPSLAVDIQVRRALIQKKDPGLVIKRPIKVQNCLPSFRKRALPTRIYFLPSPQP